jgi:DNA polymerase-3 subunit alpha
MDHVELHVQESSGHVMRMSLPCRVDARNRLLQAEILDLMGDESSVVVA